MKFLNAKNSASLKCDIFETGVPIQTYQAWDSLCKPGKP